MCWHPHVPINISIITPGNIHYLWVECIQPSLDISGKLCLLSSCINSSSSVQVYSRTCHRSIQTFDYSGTMLDGGSLASHSSLHGGRHSSAVPCHKRSCHGCFRRPGAQGSFISVFNSLATQRCVLYTQEFFSLVCQAVVWGNLSIYCKIYQQSWKE